MKRRNSKMMGAEIQQQLGTEPVFPRTPAKAQGLFGNTGFRAAIAFAIAYFLKFIVRVLPVIAVCRVVFLFVISEHSVTNLALSLLDSWLDSWLAIEVIFIGVTWWRARQLSRRRLPFAFPRRERDEIAEKILRHLEESAKAAQCVDPRDGTLAIFERCHDDCPHTIIRAWHRGASWKTVTRMGVEAWAAWALFASMYEELNSYQRTEVSEFIAKVEACSGIRLNSSRDGAGTEVQTSRGTAAAKRTLQRHGPILLTLDTIQWMHRPLMAYVGTHLIVGNIAGPLALRYFGYQPVRSELAHSADVRFWYKQHSDDTKKTKRTTSVADPTKADGICFLHGIGAGPLPYLHEMLSQISTLTGLPILIVETPYIALRLEEPDPRGPDATSEAIATALRHVGIERCCVIGHSYGTVMTAWMLRHCPELVHSSVLIDPVALLLARADVAYSVIHRKPQSPVDILLEYFVFRELSVANALARSFVWHRNVLWAEDMPQGGRSSVLLSANDAIVPSAAVRTYLTERRVPWVWMEGVGHAGFLMRSVNVSQVVDAVQRVTQTSI